MTAAVVTLAITIVGLVGVLTWLVYGRVAAADQAADARVAQVATEAELERAHFELETATKALEAAHKRADALEEVIQHEVDAAPNPDLARNDVRGRVLRIAQRWAEADRNRTVPAEPSDGVPVVSSTEATTPRAVPAGAGVLPR